jgi:phospholipase/carboxylesterase
MLRLLALVVLFGAHAHAKLDHLEFVTGGAAANAKLPMIVAIHGLGDRPEAFAGLLKALPMPARVIVPRGKRAWGKGHTWFAIERPPGPKMVADMADSVAQLTALIDGLQKTRPTVGKPVVTGFSQGGMLSFALAAAHPARWTAAVPIAGALPEALLPKAKSQLQVYALHGADDDRIPAKYAEVTVQALRARGYTAELRAFAGVKHSISREMRRALFEYLAQVLPQ